MRRRTVQHPLALLILLVIQKSHGFKSLGHQYFLTSPCSLLHQRHRQEKQAQSPEELCPPGYYLDSVHGCCSPLGPLGRASQVVETSVPVVRTLSSRISSLFGIDKGKIAKLGIPFVLSYSLVSTINGSISLAVSWYMTTSRTGISPLVKGQWKELLKSYGTIYAIIQLLRPFRVAAAIAMSKLSNEMLTLTQEKLDCSKRAAILYQYALGWVAWLLTSVLGVQIASACSGVPILP